MKKKHRVMLLLLLAVNMLVSCLITASGVWHVAQTRTLKDAEPFVLAISALIGVVYVFFTIRLWTSQPQRFTRWDKVVWALSAPLAIPLLGVSYYIFGICVKDAFFEAAGLFGTDPDSAWAVLMAATVPLALGAALFYFRLQCRCIYGLTEAIVGVVIAVYKVTSVPVDALPTNPDFALALLTASVYLIVRGFDNVHQGLTKEPIDKVAAVAIKWLRTRSPLPQRKTRERREEHERIQND